MGPPVLALLLLVPAPTVGVAMAFLVAPGPVGNAAYLVSKVWILAFPILWLRLVDEKPLSLSRPARGGLRAGLFLGLLMSGTIVLAFALLGERWIDVDLFRRMASETGIGTVPAYLGLVLSLTLINSLLEEYVWRWFVFRRCEELLPGAAAVLASALFFTLHHTLALELQFGQAVAILGSVGIFAGGAIWSWCYLRYRSIWPGYLSHAVVDAAVFSIGYRLLFG